MKNFFLLIISIFFFSEIIAQTIATTETEIIYGRKDGLAMTMVKTAPTGKNNGKAIVYVVSGNWRSSHGGRPAERIREFVNRGYTLFEVIHGSQPKYTVWEAVADLQRAVRFIKYNAKEYGIDPDKIGISGASSGGHLSLMIGLLEGKGDTASKDPINHLSSKVKAVAVFYPPTNLLQWGVMKDAFLDTSALKMANIAAAFDLKVWNAGRANYSSVTDAESRRMQLMNISPVNLVSSDDPPVYIIHGDKDRTVPLQQSQDLVAKLKEAKVPVELQVKPGADHGWPNLFNDIEYFISWFDKYLK